jgi:hypothetical protein
MQDRFAGIVENRGGAARRNDQPAPVKRLAPHEQNSWMRRFINKISKFATASR